MKISEIDITFTKPRLGIVGYASFVLNDSIYCGFVAIHNRPNGDYRLSYPRKIVAGSQDRNVFYPITVEAGKEIEEAIINRFKELSAN